MILRFCVRHPEQSDHSDEILINSIKSINSTKKKQLLRNAPLIIEIMPIIGINEPDYRQTS